MTPLDSALEQLRREARQLAASARQASIRPEHLLSVLSREQPARIRPWLAACGLQPDAWAAYLDEVLRTVPTHSLSGRYHIEHPGLEALLRQRGPASGPLTVEAFFARYLQRHRDAIEGALGPFALPGQSAAGIAWPDPPPAHPATAQRAPAAPRLPEELPGVDLTAAIRESGSPRPVIGRDEEVRQLIEALLRHTKPNAVLVGPAGVGKTAVVELLCQRIVAGDVPERLAGVRIVEVRMGDLVAGTRYRGAFEARIQELIAWARGHREDAILFIDELHTIVGTGGGEGSMDAANLLKPALARGDIRVVGATTHAEYARFVARDKALSRRFSPVRVEEPSPQATHTVLRCLAPALSTHHGLQIDDAALDAAVQLSSRYLRHQHLPDKAIDLLDRALARRRTALGGQQEGTLRREHVAETVQAITGVPVGVVEDRETAEGLLGLADALSRVVVGQPEAIAAVARAIQRQQVGLKRGRRPAGAFLFLGATGVGKTELAKALASWLFGAEDALIRLDMSEYQSAADISKLVGASPMYVGYEDGGALTEAIRQRPFAIVLFDEIEKAHPAVLTPLLQLLDDGRLTDGQGTVHDFSNAVIVLTSNIGQRTDADASDPEARRESYRAAARRALKPELLNRLDVVVFDRLDREHASRIARHELEKVRAHCATTLQLGLSWSEHALQHIVEQGFSETYGARAIVHAVRTHLENPLASAILAHRIQGGLPRAFHADVLDGTIALQPAEGP